MARLALAAGLGLLLSAAGATAQTVSLNGSMGDRALLIIDGQPRMLAVGATQQGVTLLKVGDGEAQVSVGGRAQTLRIGGVPGRVGAGPSSGGGTSIVLTAGLGGHFSTTGTINGRSVQFLVDTGATAVSIGQSEAQRIGLDYQHGERVMMNTANGAVPAYMVTLSTVRVGDVEVANVPAVVLPAPMGQVLLGNSFLTRFQMKRENDTLMLVKRP
jgi:aspartyl protease family protein